MLKNSFITLLILFFTVSAASAQIEVQKLSTVEDTQQLSKEVTDLFKDSRIDEAVEKMKVYWPISEAEIEGFQSKTEKYLRLLGGSYGAVIGVEKIKSEKLSDFALRETYVMRYENSALRLMFTYYKGKDNWILNSFKWDENFSELFVEE